MVRRKGFGNGLPTKALIGYPIWLALALLILALSSTSAGAIFLNSISTIPNTAPQWFQRSGSLVTVICAIIEALILVRLHRQMKGEPTMETASGFLTIEEMKYLDVLQWVALVLLVVGTVVWGYGDVLYETMLGRVNQGDA